MRFHPHLVVNAVVLCILSICFAAQATTVRRDDLAGLASNGAVYYSTNKSTWNGARGMLTSLTAGDFTGNGVDGLIGLASNHSIWYTTDRLSWKQVAGSLTQLSSGDLDGTGRDGIVGIASNGTIWYSADLSNWKSVPGHLSSLAVGDIDGNGKADIVGLAADHSIWYTTDRIHWTSIPGTLTSLACGDLNGDGADDLVGLAADGSIWVSTDKSTWSQLPGRLTSLNIGDFNGDGRKDIAGIASDGGIYYTTDRKNWTRISGRLSSLVVGDFNGDGVDDLAGLAADGSVWYSTDKSSWTKIPGQLSTLVAGNFDGSGSVSVDSLYATPQQITMIAGTTYDFLRVHALGTKDDVVTSGASFTSKSTNESVVSVADAGLDESGQYRQTRLTAKSPGNAVITVSAGGVSTQVNVLVIGNDNPRFSPLPVNAWGYKDVPVANDAYKYYYFYVQPGTEQHLVVTNSEGSSYVDVSTDPSFSTRISGGWNDYNLYSVADSAHATYYVRVRGQSSVNSFDINTWTIDTPNIYHPRNHVTPVASNDHGYGVILGDEEQRVFSFPVKAGSSYWVRVENTVGSSYVETAHDKSFASKISSGWNDFDEQVVGESSDSTYFVRITGKSLSCLCRLRTTPSGDATGGPRVDALPRRITLPLGTSTSVYSQCIDPYWKMSTASQQPSWESLNPSLLGITSGAFDVNSWTYGAKIQATSAISGNVQDTAVTSQTTNAADRIAVRLVDLNSIYGDNHHQLIPNAGPAAGSISKNDNRMFWFQASPGTEYSIKVQCSSGSAYVKVFADALQQTLVASGWSDYTRRFVSSEEYGTFFVVVIPSSGSITYSARVDTISSATSYFPKGAVFPLMVNGSAISARTGETETGESPDIFSFVTPDADAVFKVAVTCDIGQVYVKVTEDRAGEENVNSGWSDYGYSFTSPTAGKKYYVHVYGKYGASHYQISVTRK